MKCVAHECNEIAGPARDAPTLPHGVGANQTCQQANSIPVPRIQMPPHMSLAAC